jgi:hypothetical protein
LRFRIGRLQSGHSRLAVTVVMPAGPGPAFLADADRIASRRARHSEATGRRRVRPEDWTHYRPFSAAFIINTRGFEFSTQTSRRRGLIEARIIYSATARVLGRVSLPQTQNS